MLFNYGERIYKFAEAMSLCLQKRRYHELRHKYNVIISISNNKVKTPDMIWKFIKYNFLFAQVRICPTNKTEIMSVLPKNPNNYTSSINWRSSWQRSVSVTSAKISVYIFINIGFSSALSSFLLTYHVHCDVASIFSSISFPSQTVLSRVTFK